ncbi:uncharacterized protein LOC113874502 [Abrus precatorius]|uniref:Uncharacterized protein LOC113874502 n=1 Tax=Abrus precatorius TaxID=3816 RepID=A0A8B8MIW6_ABRPR|nr:uncharacterized protein LOC113874502 [Abrus precatorius]
MEANRRRVFTRRKPLSDCTNTQSSPSSVPLKTSKSKPSSSSSAINKAPTKCTSATANLGNAPNPSSPSPPNLSTPSVKTPPSFALPNRSLISVLFPRFFISGIVDVKASPPISVVFSRRHCSKKRRKDKGKEVGVPVSSSPILNISNNRETSDGFESENLPKAKALTVPCAKKQRAMSSEDVFNDPFKDPQVQDFIEEQKPYFKMIDEFELLEEEVESSDELD